jgi:hypothetical protein
MQREKCQAAKGMGSLRQRIGGLPCDKRHAHLRQMDEVIEHRLDQCAFVVARGWPDLFGLNGPFWSRYDHQIGRFLRLTGQAGATPRNGRPNLDVLRMQGRRGDDETA